MDCSLPGSSVLGISQKRILEWVARYSSRGSSWRRDRTHISGIGRWNLYHWATQEAASTGRVKFKTGNPGDSESLWVEPYRLVHTNWAQEPRAQFRLLDTNIINPWLFNRSLLLGPYFLDNQHYPNSTGISLFFPKPLSGLHISFWVWSSVRFLFSGRNMDNTLCEAPESEILCKWHLSNVIIMLHIDLWSWVYVKKHTCLSLVLTWLQISALLREALESTRMGVIWREFVIGDSLITRTEHRNWGPWAARLLASCKYLSKPLSTLVLSTHIKWDV